MLTTVKDYAQERGVSQTAVKKACRKGKKLIGVKSYIKIGGQWLLTVESKLVKKNIGRCIVVS